MYNLNKNYIKSYSMNIIILIMTATPQVIDNWINSNK